jgi:hypothetical protein
MFRILFYFILISIFSKSFCILVFKDAEWSDLANYVVGNSGVGIEIGHSRIIITHTSAGYVLV